MAAPPVCTRSKRETVSVVIITSSSFSASSRSSVKKSSLRSRLRRARDSRAISFRTHRHLEDGFLLRFPREHVELLNLDVANERSMHSLSVIRALFSSRTRWATRARDPRPAPRGRFFSAGFPPRYTPDTIDARSRSHPSSRSRRASSAPRVAVAANRREPNASHSFRPPSSRAASPAGRARPDTPKRERRSVLF